MKCKIFGILVVLCVFLCCASPGTKQAKIYEGQLETMIGKNTDDMETTFKEWGFNLMYTWQDENPSVEVIKEHNRPVVKFSDPEIQQIFSEKRELEKKDSFLTHAPYRINKRETNVIVKSREVIQVACTISREKGHPECVNMVNLVDVLVGGFSQVIDFTSTSRGCLVWLRSSAAIGKVRPDGPAVM